ncbi:MAG: hypothetical protein U0800_03230 [Isosphaeraceae bacterium]
MKNLLLEEVRYKVEETPNGTWRRFVYPNGQLFQEYVDNRQVFGLPLIHYTHGPCPETGRRVVATGFIAVGRLAVGVVAIGHASLGVVAIGQLALGLLLGLGQASTGALAIGQLAVGLAFGLGQLVTGYVAIGQFGLGRYVLAQLGAGVDVWDIRAAAPEAVRFFKSWLPFPR